VLAKLARLPLSTWSYKHDGVRHIGPMAQDFFAVYGFGEDRRHITTSDLAGVGLAADKALNRRQRKTEGQLRSLRRRNHALAKRLHRLEHAVSRLRR
jgi:hypothetical protein